MSAAGTTEQKASILAPQERGLHMKHVISGSGCHRIECGSVIGEMTGYRGIARLEIDGKVFCATTEYWAGTLPPMFDIRPVAHTEDYRKEGITEADQRGLKASMDFISRAFSGAPNHSPKE
jgi:hypothetical protein